MALAKETRIVMTADDRTKRAFSSVQSAVRKTEQDFKSMAKGLAAVTAAAAAISAGLTLLTRRALDSADAIAKTADRVGVSTDALQEYRHAAELSGVETAKLDSAFEAFSKRLGEVRAGTGTLTTFLQKYDETLLQVVRSADSTDAALDAIFEAMGRAETAADRAALSSAAFGRTAGVQMANLVRQGTDGLADMRAEARRLGLVLEEGLLRSAEDVNDAISRMERIVGTNLQRVLLTLAPTVESLSLSFADAAPAIAEFADNIVKFLFGVEALSLDALRRELRELTGEVLRYAATAKPLREMTDAELAAHRERVMAYDAEEKKLAGLIETREAEIEARRKMFANDNDGGGPKLTPPEEEPEVVHQGLVNNQIEGMVAARNAAILAMNDERRAADLEREKTFDAHRQAVQQQGMLALSRLSTLQQSTSRRMFEVGKAAAIAETVIDTYKSAQASYSALAGIPIVGPALGAAAAAAAIAAGMARVQAIKSQQFGGGGSASGDPGAGAAPGSGGAAPGAPGANLPDLAPANDNAPRGVVNVTLQGEVFTRDFLADSFIPLINELSADGAKIVVTGG